MLMPNNLRTLEKGLRMLGDGPKVDPGVAPLLAEKSAWRSAFMTIADVIGIQYPLGNSTPAATATPTTARRALMRCCQPARTASARLSGWS